MKKLILACLLLLATPSIAQSPSDDELAKAFETCREHGNFTLGPRQWEPGWEHCAVIEKEMTDRKAAKEKSDAFSRDIAKKLAPAPK